MKMMAGISEAKEAGQVTQRVSVPSAKPAMLRPLIEMLRSNNQNET
jgi:hypothetical protein